MTIHLVYVVVLLMLAACRPQGDNSRSAEPAVGPDDTIELVVVDRPIVLGFFPPASHTTDAEGSGYAEGLAHVELALRDAAACLGRDSALVRLVVDTAVRVRQGARTDTLRFPRVDSLSYGIYLIAPKRTPFAVRAPAGPSQLIPEVMAAIPDYFLRPPCPERPS